MEVIIKMTIKERISRIRSLIMVRGIHGVADLVNDNRAFTLTKIMDIVIAIIFVAVLLPVGFSQWQKAGADMISPGSSLATIWDIAPVLITLGVVVGLVYMALGRRT